MKLTPIFIGLIIVAIAVYDVWVIVMHGSQESISHYLIDWSYKHPVLPFVMGFAMGHLFWQYRGDRK